MQNIIKIVYQWIYTDVFNKKTVTKTLKTLKKRVKNKNVKKLSHLGTK